MKEVGLGADQREQNVDSTVCLGDAIAGCRRAIWFEDSGASCRASTHNASIIIWLLACQDFAILLLIAPTSKHQNG